MGGRGAACVDETRPWGPLYPHITSFEGHYDPHAGFNVAHASFLRRHW